MFVNCNGRHLSNSPLRSKNKKTFWFVPFFSYFFISSAWNEGAAQIQGTITLVR